jgi:hypothetical protein
MRKEEKKQEEQIQHKSLYQALASFQQDVPQLLKNTKGYGYNYTDLSEIIKIINPYMKKHGLGFSQPLQKKENNGIRTVIFHVDTSEVLDSYIDLIEGVQLKGMNDFQVLGSQISYLRRYALVSALGLVSDSDTDASGEQIKKKQGLTQERFKKALQAILDGDYSIELLKEKYQLTEDQLQQLNEI